jgi:hypothetical protein
MACLRAFSIDIPGYLAALAHYTIDQAALGGIWGATVYILMGINTLYKKLQKMDDSPPPWIEES